MFNNTVRDAGLARANGTTVLDTSTSRNVLDVILLFDVSVSEDERAAGPDSPRRIDLLSDAARTIVETIAKDDDVNEQVRICLMTFSETIKVYVNGKPITVDDATYEEFLKAYRNDPGANHGKMRATAQTYFCRPRDVVLPVFATEGGTDLNRAEQFALAVESVHVNGDYELNQEHYQSIVAIVSDFEAIVTPEVAKDAAKRDDGQLVIWGFSTIPVNPKDPNFRRPWPYWCPQEAIPNSDRFLAVKTSNDLEDGYQQFANLAACAIRVRTQTSPGEKPVVEPEMDPLQDPDNKLIVPKLDSFF